MRNLVAPSGDVSSDIRSLGFIKHPSLVLPVVGILLAEIVTDYLPRALFVYVTEFTGKFGRSICRHSLECRPEDRYVGRADAFRPAARKGHPGSGWWPARHTMPERHCYSPPRRLATAESVGDRQGHGDP